MFTVYYNKHTQYLAPTNNNPMEVKLMISRFLVKNV